MLSAFAFVIFIYWCSRIPNFLPSRLRRLPALVGDASRSRVSLVIAARDEGPHIKATVKSFASQDYPDLEIIVVNDRSKDETRSVLESLKTEEPRLKVIHNEELPEGWLGKCWAINLGSQIATGEWLLFSDGDVLLEKGALIRAVNTAEQNAYDHLCMAPRIISANFLQEAVTQSLALLFFLFQNPKKVFDSNSPKAYMGIGAFNLVRRSTYQSFGGHKELRLEVVDDVFLGMLVKKSGGKSSFFLGPDAAYIHWYSGLFAYIRGLEKNAFAGLRFSLVLLSIALIGQTIIFFVPLFMVGSGYFIPAVLGGLSLLVAHGVFFISCVRQGTSGFHALLLLPAILLQFYTFTRSAFFILKRGGVVWRETFYPLRDLRAAQARLRGPWI